MHAQLTTTGGVLETDEGRGERMGCECGGGAGREQRGARRLLLGTRACAGRRRRAAGEGKGTGRKQHGHSWNRTRSPHGGSGGVRGDGARGTRSSEHVGTAFALYDYSEV